MFDKITMQLENGNEFVIEAKNNSKENVYVDEIQLNGKGYNKNFVKHSVIQDGGKIDFSMTAIPNKKRGTTKESFPYSMTNEE
jgi:putative alpha-1,2-mannosidase